MGVHKFKHGSNGTGSYDHVVFCEYCGHVAFYANKFTNSFKEMQAVAKEPCERSPEKVES